MKASVTGPLEWSEEILQEIFRHTPVGVVLADVHGTIFDANDAFCSIVDYPRDLVVGRAASSFLFPDDVPRAADVLDHLSADSSASRRAVHRLQARSGKTVWVNSTISRVVSSTNEPICLIAFVEDIGERMAIENALREKEMLYRQVVENQTEMIVRTDAGGIRLFANEAYARYFGLNEREITNTSTLPLVVEADRDALLAGMALMTPEEPVRTFTYRVIAADGSIRWTEWTSHASFDVNGSVNVVQSIGRDVTERISANEALRASELRYRRLFEDLPGPAWESDWSELVDFIRGRGIHSTEEFLAHAAAHPEDIPRGIGHVRPLSPNSAALKLAGASDVAGFAKWLIHAYTPASVPALMKAVAAVIFDNATTVRAELAMFTPDGQARDVDFHWARVRLPQSDWRIINTLSDVTERKQIERELRQSEEKYRDLFHRLPVAAWEIDWSAAVAKWKALGIHSARELLDRLGVDEVFREAGRCPIIVVNERALDVSGMPDASSFATSRWLAVRPEDREPLAFQVASVLFDEQPLVVVDLEAARSNGTRYVQLSSTPNTALPGRLTNTAVDITERKLAEEALRQSESLYRLLFHSLPVAVWDTDWSPALERWRNDGALTVDDAVAWLRGGNRTLEELKALRTVIEANQNALNLAGAADLDSFAEWLATAIRREDIGRVVPSIVSVILGKQAQANVEVRVERCDGVVIDMEMQIVAQVGYPGRVISSATDVTEKKRIERELLHSQLLLERAQAIAHTGSWELSIENDEIFGSREYWNIHDGYDGGPVRRKLSAAFERIHLDDRAALWKTLSEAHDEFMTRGPAARERTMEMRVVHPDGSVRIVRAQGVFTRTPEGEVRGYGIARDITEQKRAEEAAQRQREELTRADRMISLGILVSGVAHEINNPNHLIMLNAPLLRSAWDDISPVVDEHLARSGEMRVAGLPWSEMRTEIPEIIREIELGAERIRTIVAELRGFARDQTPGELRSHSANDVVRGALRLLANHLRKATKNFSANLGADLPEIEANAQRLEQVIVNLVLNSCQALPDSAAAITVSTRLNRDEQRVEIRVVDEGIGIKPDDLRKIRDPFFTTKRAEGGMGLGLAVSDRIVEEHNGFLTFNSEPGRGTTAVVSLPVSTRG